MSLAIPELERAVAGPAAVAVIASSSSTPSAAGCNRQSDRSRASAGTRSATTPTTDAAAP